MKPVLVLLGIMARMPFAGVAWQALHYLEGFRRLGFDVYYVEDTGDWPYDPERNAISGDPTYAVNYIRGLLARLDMSDRWAYVAASQNNQVFGLSRSRLAQLWRDAEVLVNLTAGTVLRDEHMRVPARIYLETDPVLPQIEVAQGKRFTIDLLAAHTHHFSYGENFGRPDCRVPIQRFHYHPTRQPLVVQWWQPDAAGARPAGGNRSFTTVTNWRQTQKDLEWDGQRYTWSKHYEFLKFIDLPRRTSAEFELALAGGDAEAISLLRANGWRVTDALALSRDILPYRDFILGSRGEFTVAKDQNIRLRSGWFSDRSACYLAAGKPVVTQDTAFGHALPTGRGLFAFRTMDDVLAALDAIAGDYAGHCRAAAEIARHYFAADVVLGSMLNVAGIGVVSHA